jgi:hypothetical protein
MMKYTLSGLSSWGVIKLNGKSRPVPSFTKYSFTEMLRSFFNIGARPQRLLLAGMLIFFFLLALDTLLLAFYIYQPDINTFLANYFTHLNPAGTSQAVLPIPVETPVQAPSCDGASLQIGSDTWQVESAWRASDGSINVPGDTSGTAYWVQDPQNIYIFALSPTQANLDLFSSLQDGEMALLTTRDCDSVTFRLSAPQPGEPGSEVLVNQPPSGIIIYIPHSSLALGTYTSGILSDVTITSLAESDPAPVDPQVDISLLNVSTPTYGIHIQVVVTLLNTGTTPITVSNSDFTLIPSGVPPLELIQSYPSLPARLNPDQVVTLNLVFPRPSTPTATLKIFSTNYNLNGY